MHIGWLLLLKKTKHFKNNVNKNQQKKLFFHINITFWEP